MRWQIIQRAYEEEPLQELMQFPENFRIDEGKILQTSSIY